MIEGYIKKQRNYCILLFILPIFLLKAGVPMSYSIISLCFLFVFCVFFRKKLFRDIAFSLPLIIWMILTLYHCTNAYIKHVPGVDFVDFLHGLKIYACIVIFAYWGTRNFYATVSILIAIFIARNCLCIIDYLTFGGIRQTGRMNTTLGVSTFLGQFAAITGIFITYANALKKINWQKNIGLFLIPFIVVILTQTRQCLAMLSCCVLFVYIIKKKRQGQSIITSALFFVIIAAAAAYLSMGILSETDFGRRITDKKDAEENSYYIAQNKTNTIFDKIVGDRLIYYVQGWEYFKTSPITGIGMWRYESLSGGRYPLHSEYMVHICEGGIIAIALWLLFLILVFKIILTYKGNPYVKYSALGSIFVTLFCAIYAREFFYEMFYPIYGLAISLKYQNKGINYA